MYSTVTVLLLVPYSRTVLYTIIVYVKTLSPSLLFHDETVQYAVENAADTLLHSTLVVGNVRGWWGYNTGFCTGFVRGYDER
jgi:hypothetical protein